MIAYVNVSSQKKKKILKIVSISLGLTILIFGISFLIFYPLAVVALDSFKETLNQAKRVEESIKKQDVIEARENSLILKERIEGTKEALSFYQFSSYIPFVGNYYKDSQRALNAGTHAADMAIIISDSLIPFADSLGLKGKEGGSTEEKVSKLVQIMPKILPKVDVLEGKIKLIKNEISGINPQRYPEEFKGIKLRQTLNEVQNQVNSLEKLTPELRPILSVLPNALGDPLPKGYLVLLQNDGELRSTGGFITSVAYLRIVKGQITEIKSEDIYNLDERIKSDIAAPPQIKKYLKVDKFYLRDSNVSPDFVDSMEKFREFYRKDPEKFEYDGIIALDTEFVRKIIQMTGPITTERYKETFSAELNSNNISDVVYKLELYSQKLLVEKGERKDLLGDLLNSLLKSVLSAPGNKLPSLIETAFGSTQEKHLLLYSFDQKAQALIEKHNMAGRIKDFQGDYLHLNQNNYGGLKSNLFVTEVIEQDIQINENGEVNKSVKLHLSNPHKEDGWLNGIYNDYIRFYAPIGSRLSSSDSNYTFEEGSDLDKTTFTTFATLTPQKSLTIALSYTLPSKFSKGKEYALLMQKQPGAKGPRIIIKINDKEVENSRLTTDKEFRFKI